MKLAGPMPQHTAAVYEPNRLEYPRFPASAYQFPGLPQTPGSWLLATDY